jgi:hypothetical protein
LHSDELALVALLYYERARRRKTTVVRGVISSGSACLRKLLEVETARRDTWQLRDLDVIVGAGNGAGNERCNGSKMQRRLRARLSCAGSNTRQ